MEAHRVLSLPALCWSPGKEFAPAASSGSEKLEALLLSVMLDLSSCRGLWGRYPPQGERVLDTFSSSRENSL
eukprot:139213-Hanusia_phi.AAC.1